MDMEKQHEDLGNTLILGVAGSGKSTLLRRMAKNIEGNQFFLDADNYFGRQERLMPLLKTIIRTAIQEESPLTICTDSLVCLPRIEEIDMACRHRHIRLVIATQDISQIERYPALLQNSKTFVFMRTPDPATNDFAERFFRLEKDCLRTLDAYKALIIHNGQRAKDFYGIAA